MKLNIKPLSVNEAYQGKRFKTKKHNAFVKECLFLLPKIRLIPQPPYSLFIRIGVSANFDVDNALKPFIDVLQKKYGINDRYVHKIEIEKDVVKKGCEYIFFDLQHFCKK
jgi:Holliday junction resolvase RusA-like endonuclease